MSKVLVIGDIHLKHNNLDTAEKFFDFIESKILRNSDHAISGIVFLGDVYDTKAIIRSEAQNFFISRVLKIKDLCGSDFKIHILVGNHDYENLDCVDHALMPLSFIDGVYVYDKPVYVSHLKSVFIPYIHDKKAFLDIVDKKYKEHGGDNYVFCHQGFLNFDYGNGILDKDGADPNHLPDFKKFICGHYHLKQDLGKIFYTGTPYSHSFGEANQNKFVYIFDISSGLFTEIVTESVPKHLKADLEMLVSKDARELIKEDDYVSITVKCDKKSVKDNSKDIIAKKYGLESVKNLKIKYEIIDDSVDRLGLDENSSYEEILLKYLEITKSEDLYDDAMRILKDAAVQI